MQTDPIDSSNSPEDIQELSVKPFLAFALSTALSASVALGQPLKKPEQMDKFLTAIKQVESGGMPNGGQGAVGDNGKALGPYQIHEVYWKDAVAFDKSIGGTYADCADEKYAQKIVRAYMKRYGKPDMTMEDFARLHNSGPGWAKKKPATDGYWAKVQKALKGEKVTGNAAEQEKAAKDKAAKEKSKASKPK